MLTGAVYIKIIGVILVISGCTGVGLTVGGNYSRRYRQLEMLKHMVTLLMGEIRYAPAELPEIFLRVAERVSPPFDGFLKGIIGEMSAMDGRTLAQLWREGVERSLSGTCLTREDKNRLDRLGAQLGILDRETQLSVMALYLQELETAMAELGRTMGQKQKVSLSLGLLSGLFLTVILL